VLEKYPNEVKLIFLSYPLRRHRFSKKAAVAAFAARRQGKFWDYHDRLFENYDSLSDQKIRQIARELGLDLERFEKDMNDLRIVARINQDIRLGAYMEPRVTGTPSVFINGRKSRARTLEALQVAVEKELEKFRRVGSAAGRKAL
jgi:protein-disulfide isomerase